MTTYLLDELSIGHIGKTIRITDGMATYEGVLINFETNYDYKNWCWPSGEIARTGVQKLAVLHFENSTWYADFRETFTVVD
jgi:hypothetical protein